MQIGDAANRNAPRCLWRCPQGTNDKRFRIEHAQIVAPEDFAKFKRFSYSPPWRRTHATSDMPWAQTRVGPERIKGRMPGKLS